MSFCDESPGVGCEREVGWAGADEPGACGVLHPERSKHAANMDIKRLIMGISWAGIYGYYCMRKRKIPQDRGNHTAGSWGKLHIHE